MGCDVFANGNEIACKAGGGKVIAAFPDVCLSPPSPPAGPIPVPYPDTSFAKDTKSGSKSVKIKNKEIMLKDKSFYKSAPLGDEAATKGLGAGVVTHVITGKTYFIAWSMDVKFEGKNVDRHTDLTTSNHASPGGNSAPMLNFSTMAMDRIRRGECPCCGDENCVAAFQEGEEPINFEEFFRLNERGHEDRRRQYDEMLRKKREECTCDGEVFPSEPCNVFRRDYPPGKRREARGDWEDYKSEYAEDFRENNPGAANKFIKNNMKDIKELGKPRVHGNFRGGDHLVGVAAGGCPNNPKNLQPNDLLCKPCRETAERIDGWVGNET